MKIVFHVRVIELDVSFIYITLYNVITLFCKILPL